MVEQRKDKVFHETQRVSFSKMKQQVILKKLYFMLQISSNLNTLNAIVRKAIAQCFKPWKKCSFLE